MENLQSKPFWDRSPLDSLADGYKKLPRNFKLCMLATFIIGLAAHAEVHQHSRFAASAPGKDAIHEPLLQPVAYQGRRYPDLSFQFGYVIEGLGDAAQEGSLALRSLLPTFRGVPLLLSDLTLNVCLDLGDAFRVRSVRVPGMACDFAAE